MDNLEVFGYIAAILVCGSMAFKTTTFNGTILMRIINGLGSTCFIVYALGLQEIAWATVIANIAAIIINIVFLVIEIKAEIKRGK